MFLSWRVTFQILGQSNKLNFVKAGTCFYILKLGFFENLKRVVFLQVLYRKVKEITRGFPDQFSIQIQSVAMYVLQRKLAAGTCDKVQILFSRKIRKFFYKNFQTGCYLPNFPKRSHTFDIFIRKLTIFCCFSICKLAANLCGWQRQERK